MILLEHVIRFRIHMETVAVVRSKYCGKSELNVPGVREQGHDIGERQVQLLLADGGVCGPGEVTAEASEVNRCWVSQVRISDDKYYVKKKTNYEQIFLPLICPLTALGL